MSSIWDLLGPTIGALATIAGVLAGGSVGTRSQERHWTRDSCREASADVLHQYAVIHEQMSRWARRRELPEINWPAWNQAMNALRLVASPEVVEAGDAIDEQFWVIDFELKNGNFGLENWLRMQGELEPRHLAFVNAVRVSLSAKAAPLRRSVGRPEPGHPIWEMRSSMDGGVAVSDRPET
jgi:hypothetical protein